MDSSRINLEHNKTNISNQAVLEHSKTNIHNSQQVTTDITNSSHNSNSRQWGYRQNLWVNFSHRYQASKPICLQVKTWQLTSINIRIQLLEAPLNHFNINNNLYLTQVDLINLLDTSQHNHNFNRTRPRLAQMQVSQTYLHWSHKWTSNSLDRNYMED